MAQIMDQRMADGVRAALGGISITGDVYGCYASNAAAGIALVALTTSNHPTLANYSNSGVALGIRSVTLSQIADGANAPGCVVWGYLGSLGSAAATGAPIASGTAIAAGTHASSTGALATRYLGGANYTPRATWYPATVTFTAAPTYLGPVGQSLATLATATAAAPHSTVLPYCMVLAPGAALSLAYNTTTTTVKYQIRIDFDEIVLS
jgi:hypothetical protein